MQYYYVNAKEKKDGPHDIVTIMRRIRSGIILPDTVFHYNDELVAAHSIDEISHFFNRPVEDIRQELQVRPTFTIKNIFSKGWQFTADHQNMTVFAGSILLFSALFGVLGTELFRNIYSGIISAWIMFVLLQNCFFAVSLRLYRGQKVDIDFIEHQLAPIMGKIAFVSVIFALLMVLGLGLLVIPSIFIMLLCAYMPMFILDYDYGIKKTITLILSTLKKLDSRSMLNLAIAITIYLVAIALLFPIPLIMPIMAGSLCWIYEELSNS